MTDVGCRPVELPACQDADGGYVVAIRHSTSRSIRQSQAEAASNSRVACGADTASMQLDDGLYDGQSQAGFIPTPGWIPAVGTLENMRQHFRRDAASIIPDAHDQTPLGLLRGE